MHGISECPTSCLPGRPQTSLPSPVYCFSIQPQLSKPLTSNLWGTKKPLYIAIYCHSVDKNFTSNLFDAKTLLPSIYLFCHTTQSKKHKLVTHQNPSIYSCFPGIQLINVKPSTSKLESKLELDLESDTISEAQQYSDDGKAARLPPLYGCCCWGQVGGS